MFVTALDQMEHDADLAKLLEMPATTDLSKLPYLWWSRWQTLYTETKGLPLEHGPWQVCNIEDQWAAARPDALPPPTSKDLVIRFHKRFDVVGVFVGDEMVLAINEAGLRALALLTTGLFT